MMAVRLIAAATAWRTFGLSKGFCLRFMFT
jgi:hypothetical protein